jgi:outer membrane receptor protein involved in Fe transport
MSGIDTEMNYHTALSDLHDSWLGSVDFRLLGSYVAHLRSQLLPGAPIIDDAGAADEGNGVPKVKLNFLATYAQGPFSLGLMERWRSSLAQSGNPELVFSGPGIPSVAYTDVTLRYKWPFDQHQIETFLSVQNLLNKEPPVYATPQGSTTPGLFYPAVPGDDVVGRYITAGVHMKF